MRLGLLGALLLTGPSLASAAAAEVPCEARLEVLQTRATFKTRSFQGRPTRKDAVVEVEVRSTATVAVSRLEVAVFLGASLKEVAETRAKALPTTKPRLLESGGLAFRAAVEQVVPPRSTRVLRVTREELPLDRELEAVTALVVECRSLAGGGEATVVLPPAEAPWTGRIIVLALGLAVAALLFVLARLR